MNSRIADALTPGRLPALLRRAGRKGWREMQNTVRWLQDLARPTAASLNTAEGTLGRYFPALPAALLQGRADLIRALAEHFLAHRFDLLGSGWVTVRYGMQARGLAGDHYRMSFPVEPDVAGDWLRGRLNHANLPGACAVWRLVDRDYKPIDWQLDFKSGYRWSEQTWYRWIRCAPRPGADLKVPWELGRAQHLALLAWACALTRAGAAHFQDPQVYARAFRNLVLDFIAQNPVRFGVQWACAMDVGIRVANWLVAYDLFRAQGINFDPEFDDVFLASVRAHAQHIRTNLEWSPTDRGNHYLANIAGLLFAAAYLPCDPQTDAWLAFAVQELVTEVEWQFCRDGSNFESSTAYHALTSEMVAWSTALTLALPAAKQTALRHYDARRHAGAPRLQPPPLPLYPNPHLGRETPFPDWYWERLGRMADFLETITKPSGQIAQVGDNDSGRFLKIEPRYTTLSVADALAVYANLEGYSELPAAAAYYDEDLLDQRPLSALLQILAGQEETGGPHTPAWGALLARQMLAPVGAWPATALHGHSSSRTPAAPDALPECRLVGDPVHVQEFAAPGGDLRSGLVLRAFEDFGLYVYRSERLYLAIRCGGRAQHPLHPHAHDDQLSLEVSLDGSDVISDPGSCLYTPAPALRNHYRSAQAHSGPRLGGSPASLDVGLFHLPGLVLARCLCFERDRFVGCWQLPHGQVTREVHIRSDRLVVTDRSDSGHLVPVPAASAMTVGYGKQCKRRVAF